MSAAAKRPNPPSKQEVAMYYKGILDTLSRTAVKKNGVKYTADGTRLSEALQQARMARDLALDLAPDGEVRLAVVHGDPTPKGVFVADVPSYTDPNVTYKLQYDPRTRFVKCGCKSFEIKNPRTDRGDYPTPEQKTRLCKHWFDFGNQLIPDDQRLHTISAQPHIEASGQEETKQL
jgi:hypothetical protein